MKIAAIPTRTSVYWNREEYVTNSIPWNTPLAGAEKIFHPRVCYGGQPSVTGRALPYSAVIISYGIVRRNAFPFGRVVFCPRPAKKTTGTQLTNRAPVDIL